MKQGAGVTLSIDRINRSHHYSNYRPCPGISAPPSGTPFCCTSHTAYSLLMSTIDKSHQTKLSNRNQKRCSAFNFQIGIQCFQIRKWCQNHQVLWNALKLQTLTVTMSTINLILMSWINYWFEWCVPYNIIFHNLHRDFVSVRLNQ